MSEPVDALLFDLGRVVVDIDVSRMLARYAELSGLAAEHLLSRYRERVAGDEMFQRHERGEIGDDAFFHHVRARLELDLTLDQMLDGWNAIFIGEMPGVRALLAELAPRIALYAFSNTNPAHRVVLTETYRDLLAPFAKVYLSNEIGARKPEREAYLQVAEDMGVAAHRILFLDDSLANVEGARAAGLQAAHTPDPEALRAAVEGLGR